ncbi:hypothetical protein BASA81_007883 [Batrachochytrium salamandrivorans]|nr:hypothetical protein BASA81_007883 [Batrachochytrium salamandrivorans]
MSSPKAPEQEFFFADPRNLVPRPARPASLKERKSACALLVMILLVLLFFTFSQSEASPAPAILSEEVSTEYELLVPEQGNEEIKEEEEEVSAPRSMPNLTYDEVDLANHQYLIFTPSGGMSNQLMGLVNAMGLARLLNRTLYVPRIAKHTNFVNNYLKQSYRMTFAADRLLDFNLLTKYVRVIPLNSTVFKFLENFALQFPTNKIHVQTTSKHDYGHLSILKTSPAKLLRLTGEGMWASFFPSKFMTTIRRFVTFSPYLRQFALRLTQKHFPQGVFYAIHGRLGDEKYKWLGRSSSVILGRIHPKWNYTRKLYLASDSPADKFFDPVRNAFGKHNVVSLEDLDQAGDLQEFHELFPLRDVRQDILGSVEKLICAQAVEFKGSPFSTFTWDIERFRAFRHDLYPELRPA